MNYKRIYNEIIRFRKKNIIEKGIYREKHHIIPRSLGGSDYKENLVELTAREHFICHYLLVKIYNNSYKMIKALYMMKAESSNQYRYFNNRIYDKLRNQFSIIQSESQKGKNNSQYGKRWIINTETKEVKKIDKGINIENPWIYGRCIKKPKKIIKRPKKIIKKPIIKLKKKKKEKVLKTEINKKLRLQEAKKYFDLYKDSKCKSLREFCRNGYYDKSHVSLTKLLKLLPEFVDKVEQGKSLNSNIF